MLIENKAAASPRPDFAERRGKSARNIAEAALDRSFCALLDLHERAPQLAEVLPS
jgi:hypothetical protein